MTSAAQRASTTTIAKIDTVASPVEGGTTVPGSSVPPGFSPGSSPAEAAIYVKLVLTVLPAPFSCS
jgi:hypothetical protein